MTIIPFTKKTMECFIQLLEDEQSIDYNTIPIICEILEEATGYDSKMMDNEKKENHYKSFTKKQREIYKNKKRSLKMNENNGTITEQYY